MHVNIPLRSPFKNCWKYYLHDPGFYTLCVPCSLEQLEVYEMWITDHVSFHHYRHKGDVYTSVSRLNVFSGSVEMSIQTKRERKIIKKEKEI